MSARSLVWAGLSGLLLVAAFPPFSVPLATIVALVPLAFLLTATAERSAAIWVGIVWAGVFFGVEVVWISSALAPVTRLHLPAYVASVVLFALTGGVAGVVHHELGRRGVASPLAFAIALTGAEWVRAHLGPLAFPWLGIGTGVASTPLFLAPARWIGERGVTFLVALLAGSLALLFRGSDSKAGSGPRTSTVGAALTLTLLTLATWGAAVAGMPDSDDSVTNATALAVVTTAFGPSGDMSVEERLAWVETVLGLETAAGPLSVAAVLFPEATLPIPLERRPDLVRRLATLSDRANAPLVIGAYGASQDRIFNSVFLIGPDGIRERSDKRRRVAVVEAGFTSGEPRTLALEGLGLGPLVCFESLFSAGSRELARTGASVIVNPSSESWFARGRGWAAGQHSEHARNRSVEVGRPFVRAANDGESFALDASGHTTWRTRSPGVERILVRPGTSTTAFLHFGDWLGWVCGIVTLMLLVLTSGVRLPNRARPKPDAPRPTH